MPHSTQLDRPRPVAARLLDARTPGPNLAGCPETTRKRIIVLANSFKNRARCVAGRELLPGSLTPGGWVRPVSAINDGALDPRHYTLASGAPAAVLDVIEMDLTAHARDPGQPENWRMNETVPWRRIGRCSPVSLSLLREHPKDIWLDCGGCPELGEHAERREPGESGKPCDRRDRISQAAQARQATQRSLVLIKPERFRLQLCTERNTYTYCDERKTRAAFTYRGIDYALSLTDPLLRGRHTNYPAAGAPPLERALPCGDNCLLCVSLTPPFRGYHYKVVATVLETR